jgi:hypothetical protein
MLNESANVSRRTRRKDDMGVAEPPSTSTAMSAAYESVPADVYAGVDFAALNAEVAMYRQLTREHGFDAALSHYADEPVAVVSERGL